MSLELNREYPDPNEAELTEQMASLIVNRMRPQGGCMRRAQHAKPTGCVRAVFTTRSDLPDELRHGVFRGPGRSYSAVVRFSNSLEKIASDGKGSARGLAIKLQGVQGTPAIVGDDHDCQDFLTANLPVFPIATPAEYVKFFDIRAAPLLGEPLAVAWMALFHLPHLKIVLQSLAKVVASPLEETYWSGSPYWLGPPGTTGGHAVKYSLVPTSHASPPPADPRSMPDNYLAQALAQHLKAGEAVFEFRVQLQTDPVTMPVEDASVVWDENVSKPIPVATLTIGAQDLDSPESRALAEECEKMAFSPWHALAEHRPMGGINRLRKAVYLASQTNRGASNP